MIMALRLFLVLVVIAEVESAYRQVCYYTNWSQYRNGPGKFFPEDIDPNLCTHLIFSFARLVGDNLQSYEWNDESTPWMKGMYARFNELKKLNPNLKTILAVGGWTMASKPFSLMATSDVNRRQFAVTTIQFLRNHDFDGIDIDWEYPAKRGGSVSDKQTYVELIKTLRQEFDSEAQTTGSPKLILSAAIPAGKENIDDGFDVPNVAKYMDMLNLMSYDLHGSWETQTGHNSGLFMHSGETGDATHLNVDWAASYWVAAGIPPSMINIGIATYGRTFTLRDAHNHDVGSDTTGAGDPGRYTGEKGFLSYYEICEILKNGGTRYYLADQMVPYAVSGSQWIGYEEEDSIRTKVRYVKQHGFGGTMIWALDLDDFRGTCGQGKYPLLHAIDDELKKTGGATVQPIQQSSQSSSQPTTSLSTLTTQTSQSSVTTTTVVTSTTPVPTNHFGQTHNFSCTGKKSGFYPDPNSCDSYFICAAQIPFAIHCASGLLFNVNTNFCDWPKNVNCTSNHQSTAVSTSQSQAPTYVPVNTNAPTNLLVFTSTPVQTNAPTTQLVFTSTPVQTKAPTSQLVFTSTPVQTNAPTQGPVITNGPTQNPTTSNVPTQVLVFTNTPSFTFTPAVTNAPTNSPSPTQSPTNSPTSTTPVSYLANFCGQKADGLYSDSNACGYYYQCSFGITFHEPCAPGLAFNDQTDACDYPSNVPGCLNYQG